MPRHREDALVTSYDSSTALAGSVLPVPPPGITYWMDLPAPCPRHRKTVEGKGRFRGRISSLFRRDSHPGPFPARERRKNRRAALLRRCSVCHCLELNGRAIGTRLTTTPSSACAPAGRRSARAGRAGRWRSEASRSALRHCLGLWEGLSALEYPFNPKQWHTAGWFGRAVRESAAREHGARGAPR